LLGQKKFGPGFFDGTPTANGLVADGKRISRHLTQIPPERQAFKQDVSQNPSGLCDSPLT
jgi:hypothetical protein